MDDEAHIYSEIIDAAPDGIILVDKKGKIVHANQQTLNLFGYSKHELKNKPVEMLIPSRYVRSHRSHRKKYSSDPRTRPMGLDMDLYALRKDGSEFPVEISLSPLNNRQGALTIAIIRDITAKKEVELKLRQRTEEAEALNRLTVDRELKMLKLKDELKKLRKSKP
jgi:PAS domain S-box-containing protein